MRLIEIDGPIWELSCLQRGYSTNSRNVPDALANRKVVAGKDISDVTRILSGRQVRSKAVAVVEISVNGLPAQYSYDIYLGRKGFYSNVQGKRVYLADIMSEAGDGR